MRDNFIAMAKLATDDDPIFVKLAEDVADKCGSISGERCDQALAFNKCMENEARAQNIDKPDIL